VPSTDANHVNASVPFRAAVRRRTTVSDVPGWHAGLAVSGISALVALAVLVYGGIAHLGPLPLTLAGLAVLLVIVRASLALRENARLLELSHHEAITDPLTGLANRRRMTEQLAAALAAEAQSPSAVLVMFDLDGFKSYNDHFGHLAGDVLLADLGRRLEAAVGGEGTAFRLGGDEFCLLLPGDPDATGETLGRALDALAAQGEGFAVTSSYGAVELPCEARTPNDALRLADARMYAHKARRDGRASLRAHDALVGLGDEQLRELLTLILAELHPSAGLPNQ
jgi:two-component system, cell cycle response regulator